MSKLTVTLPNGLQITGEDYQVRKFVRDNGYKTDDVLLDNGYRWSETKGVYVRLSEMNVKYLQNAILKDWQKWFDEIRGKEASDFALALIVGPTHLKPLLTELRKRIEAEEGTSMLTRELRKAGY